MMSDSLTTTYLMHINLVRKEMLFSLFSILRTETPVRVHSDMMLVVSLGKSLMSYSARVFFPHLGVRSKVLTSLGVCTDKSKLFSKPHHSSQLLLKKAKPSFLFE